MQACQDDAARIEAYGARLAELAALVAAQADTIESLRQLNERLEARVAELERGCPEFHGDFGGGLVTIRRRLVHHPTAV